MLAQPGKPRAPRIVAAALAEGITSHDYAKLLGISHGTVQKLKAMGSR